MQIDLISFNQTAPIDWMLGAIHEIKFSVEDVVYGIDYDNREVNAWLFWDFSLGQPDQDLIRSLVQCSNVDVWHAGLCFSLHGQPAMLDFVRPTWLLNCDASPEIESSSWRLSLQACLVRADVIRQIGGIKPGFHNPDSAGLEFGYRCIQRGVIIRHTPLLRPSLRVSKAPQLSFEDQLRFIYYHHGKSLTLWASLRAVMSGYSKPIATLRAAQRISAEPLSAEQIVYGRTQVQLDHVSLNQNNYPVTVLIATLDRYPYLSALLAQLRNQTIRPLEILVVDQTERPRRDHNLIHVFSDLPLHIIYVDEPGQVLSRNIGLQQAQGEYVLLLDDDVEIQSDFIERHLKNLAHFAADTSSGAVDEKGALPLVGISTRTHISDVFPAGNTMIRKDVLLKSGLFDMAFQRRPSEDGDLGIRIHLSGALMIYNPDISLFHHHAPRGGLRTHGARIVTYSSSRQHLFHRRFPHISEAYISKRYYSRRQVKERFWMSLMGTFSIRGSGGRKALKILFALMLLPNSIYRLRRIHREADILLKHFPKIPQLNP